MSQHSRLGRGAGDSEEDEGLVQVGETEDIGPHIHVGPADPV